MDASTTDRTTNAFILHRAGGALLSTAFRRGGFGIGDPLARHREIAWEDHRSIAAGRASFIGELDVAGYPHTETLVVVEAQLRLTTEGKTLVVGPGAGAVIARGTPVHIEADARAVFVWCAVQGSDAGHPGIIPLRADANFKPSSPPPAETLLGPAPQCRSDNIFTDEISGYRAGTWDSTGYHRIVRPHPVHEFMHLLAGSVRFAGPDGGVLTANAGDSLFVPRGEPVGWESTGRVAKFYVVQSAQD